MALTGLGAVLISSTANTKFTSTESWKVRGITGGGRTLAVIDDSHLGQTKSQGMLKCFADLYEHDPFVVDCQLNPVNSTVFQDINLPTNPQTDTHDNPVLLGDDGGTAPTFTLTLPELKSADTQAVLTFTGAIVRDSGYNFTLGDRPRITLTIQPDMQTYQWTAAVAT
jgi:hypothetical protein